MVVIVSANSPLVNMSLPDLRRVFMGEVQYDQRRQKLIPFNFDAGHVVRQAFDLAALGLSPEAAGRHWIDRKIRGQGQPPRSVASARLIREIVLRLPGAIGYVPASELGPGVRALTIDGIKYGDPSYPLVLPGDRRR
jgi:hypothetical protein